MPTNRPSKPGRLVKKRKTDNGEKSTSVNSITDLLKNTNQTVIVRRDLNRPSVSASGSTGKSGSKTNTKANPKECRIVLSPTEVLPTKTPSILTTSPSLKAVQKEIMQSERPGRLVKKRKTEQLEKATSVSLELLISSKGCLNHYEEPTDLEELHASKKSPEVRKVCHKCRSSPHCSASLQEPLLENHRPKMQKVPHDEKYGNVLPPIKSPLLLLAVFSQLDSTSETLMRASEKLGYEVKFCDNYDIALEEFQAKLHDLVLIDTRSSKLDYDTLCRSIRNTKGTQYVVMVGVVKRSIFEKDDVTVASLLESGFNRCIVETTNILVWVNELIQLKHSDIRPMAQHSTAQVLYSALDKCKDVVVITDSNCRTQYINSSGEFYMGFRHEELLGKTLQEQLAHDAVQISTMCTRLSRSKTWQGNITMKRKTQEPITVPVFAAPISTIGRTPTHYVLILDSPGTTYDPTARGSIHSIRKGSVDVRSIGSDYLRRTSLAKLTALPLEAPITKIVYLLSQAQETAGTNLQVVNLLDKVIDMLKCSELYLPQMKEDHAKLRNEEPVTADLITALLSNNQQLVAASSRRSSNDSTVYRPTKSISKVIKTMFQVPGQIKDCLEHSLAWEFDVIRLEELTNKRPLLYLGFNLLSHFDVPAILNCDERTLYNFLILIESKYHSDNSYHNSTHAADVMHAVAGYLERERMKAIMSPMDEAAALIAAGCHDVDHPGKSSAFLSNCDNSLALLYNDITVLESHHAALTFRLALGDDRVNIFKNLEREEYKVIRQTIIDMILATEMTKHFEHLAKFVNAFSVKAGEVEEPTNDYVPIALPENIILIKRMMIKCADVSNPTRPLGLCVEWARRITEEYFQQTDEEKAKGLPVLMPMFDRTTCSIPKAQIGFVDFIINDMVEAWNAFIDFPELVTHMRQNYIKWKEYDEQGYTTLADMRKLQITVLSTSKATPTVDE